MFLIPALQDMRLGLNALIIPLKCELAIQLCHLAQKLEKKRAGALLSGENEDQMYGKFCNRRPDVLIGTSKRLNLLLYEGGMFDSVKRVMLDDGDKILQSLP